MAVVAPVRFCAAPQCPNRVPSGYCPDHQRAQRALHTRHYTGGGYYGRQWRDAARRYRAEHPFCAYPGCTELSEETDHIIPHRGDRALFWDETNWQALCKTHHSAKTAREVWHS